MKKPLAILVVAAVGAVSLARLKHAGEPDVAPAGNRLLVNRIWIDHVPRSDTDAINVFVLIGDQSAGVFHAASRWRGSYEVFRYEASGGELRLVYPQTGDREAVRAKARSCAEPGMTYCLELDGASRGVKRYYSRDGWELDSGEGLDALRHHIDTLHTRLAAGPT